jgi:transposase-like protein
MLCENSLITHIEIDMKTSLATLKVVCPHCGRKNSHVVHNAAVRDETGIHIHFEYEKMSERYCAARKCGKFYELF